MSTTYSLKFGRFIELKKTTFTKNVQISVCKNKSCELPRPKGRSF